MVLKKVSIESCPRHIDRGILILLKYKNMEFRAGAVIYRLADGNLKSGVKLLLAFV